MAKFDAQQFTKSLLKNSEYGVIGLLALVILIMIFLLSHRPNLDVPEPKLIDIQKLNFPKEAQEDLKRAVDELKPFDQSPYQKDLLQRNLYSFREVLSKQAIEKDITDKLKRAQSLFDSGNYADAIKICDEILRTDPNRVPAQVLKDKSAKANNGTPTPVPTPVPVPAKP